MFLIKYSKMGIELKFLLALCGTQLCH